MARISLDQLDRVVAIDRRDLLIRIAELLARADVHPRFRKHGWKRLRRLLRDGLRLPAEAILWSAVAIEQEHLLDDVPTQALIRQHYREQRSVWETMAAALHRIAQQRVFSTG